MFITDEEIGRLISEDVPYFDLTSHALGIGRERGQIEYFTRGNIVICGTEEAARIFRYLGIETKNCTPSGQKAAAGSVLITGTGAAEQLLMAWKAAQNILDHLSGIATLTRHMVEEARKYNPRIAILTTRKGFPGTKKLAVKATLAGGAVPHRLGISETILIFKQHLNFIGGAEGLIKKMPALKGECCEKKILVEAESYDEARQYCRAGADGIQFDKLPPEALGEAAKLLKKEFPGVTLLAAGGIKPENAGAYVKTQIDGIVTTSLFNAPPVDIGVRINPV
ncbi:ModD protein [Leadbettera azotonutricia]|uniref:Putative pyrophosphorylase ModD n=1 Tax=Leadbettera azotonutricia (strain ATCC BAA-888 / DSM 13862 / ZAS-9) TaxID=545695 RepID=F5Y721_LEAAZ|nr:ModD protein [Leadbettera azotonutricia]AEF82436.1 ModD protein [Leadbettera azotonutricia ZAS-9]